MYKTKAYSAASATSPLAFTNIQRREPTEHDVQIEILFAGFVTRTSIPCVTSGANSCPLSIPSSRATKSSAA
jgi:D-arabinose 1-dehydrogenase-like Zn-dependent alcohol dehydrogenase